MSKKIGKMKTIKTKIIIILYEKIEIKNVRKSLRIFADGLLRAKIE